MGSLYAMHSCHVETSSERPAVGQACCCSRGRSTIHHFGWPSCCRAALACRCRAPLCVCLPRLLPPRALRLLPPSPLSPPPPALPPSPSPSFSSAADVVAVAAPVALAVVASCAYRAPDPGCPPAKPCDGHVRSLRHQSDGQGSVTCMTDEFGCGQGTVYTHELTDEFG